MPDRDRQKARMKNEIHMDYNVNHNRNNMVHIFSQRFYIHC